MFNALIVIAFSLLLPLWIAWILLRERRYRRLYRESPFKVGYIGRFDGTYRPHWEIGHFVWENGIIRGEQGGNPGNYCIIEECPSLDQRKPTRLSFMGEITAIGSFGHRGMMMFKVRFLNW